MKEDDPGIENDLVLSIALKDTIETAGLNDLAPTLLIFGAIPRLPIQPQQLPDDAKIMQLMATVCKEMSRLIA